MTSHSSVCVVVVVRVAVDRQATLAPFGRFEVTRTLTKVTSGEPPAIVQTQSHAHPESTSGVTLLLSGGRIKQAGHARCIYTIGEFRKEVSKAENMHLSIQPSSGEFQWTEG